jgi:uncharacterized protein (TIGR04255 family)
MNNDKTAKEDSSNNESSIAPTAKYEKAYYEKHFLKEVIARVDFVAPLVELERSLPKKLSKVFADLFPIVEPTEAIAQGFQITPNEVKPSKPQHFKQWNFYGRQREKLLAAAASFLFLQYNRYVAYENLQTDYASVIDAIEKAFPDARARRFGLRYVNHIDIEGLSPVADWNEYINEALVATTRFFSQQRQLTRLLQLAELKEGELDVRFQFGMPNPDYPAVIRRPFFVLDLDAYVQTAHDLKESLQYIDEAHDCIQDLFEKSITDKLRKRMHGRSPTSIRR